MTQQTPGQRQRLIWAFGIAAIWVGLIAGVSFLATPVKFMAPSLSLPVALDVGRHTFAAFNKTEWVIALALLGWLATTARSAPLALAAAVVATALVALEAAWLLPELDHRVGLIIAGQTPPPSRLHRAYIIVECVKLIAVAVAAVYSARALVQPAEAAR